MKKLLCLFLTTFAAAAGTAAYAAEPADLVGAWEGWYYNNQGQTGVRFEFTEQDGKVVGTEHTYNMPGNSNVEEQRMYTEVTVSGDKYAVEETDWIGEAPYGWMLGTFYLTLEDDVLTGDVMGYSGVYLMKDNASYSDVSSSVFGNHKYSVIDESLTWQQAKAKCEEMGGHLVTINSEEEQKYIEGLIENKTRKQYWIGMSRSQDGLQWVTGEAVSYENWDGSEPNSHTRSDGEKEDYIQIYNQANPAVYSSRRFAWNDIYNDNTYPGEESFFSLENVGYICEWETWSESAEWSTPELQQAADNGLIPDVLVGKDMTQPITRGEFAAVAVNLFEAMTGGKAVMSSDCTFTDISENENRNYILKAYNIGAVNGMSETTYEPSSLLQREQLAAMLTRVYKRSEWPDWTLETDDDYTINYSGVKKFDDDDVISDYAKPSVYFMVKYNVLSGVGDNKFAPRNTSTAEEAAGYANATREQAVVMSLRSFENLKPEN